MKNSMNTAGISRWRQVGEALVQDMDHGILSPGEKLPAEPDLALRYGVARQTVRRALSHLRNERLIDVQLGRGTFVSEKVFQYRIAARKSFEENLLDSEMIPSRRLHAIEVLRATRGMAEKLDIEPGGPVLCVRAINEANGRPAVLGRVHFPVGRMEGIVEAFQKIERKGDSFSISDILKDLGIETIRRDYIRLKARLPTGEEMEILELSSQEAVMETQSVSKGPDDRLVFHSLMTYRGSLVEFFIGSEAFGGTAQSSPAA